MLSAKALRVCDERRDRQVAGAGSVRLVPVVARAAPAQQIREELNARQVGTILNTRNPVPSIYLYFLYHSRQYIQCILALAHSCHPLSSPVGSATPPSVVAWRWHGNHHVPTSHVGTTTSEATPPTTPPTTVAAGEARSICALHRHLGDQNNKVSYTTPHVLQSRLVSTAAEQLSLGVQRLAYHTHLDLTAFKERLVKFHSLIHGLFLSKLNVRKAVVMEGERKAG